MKKFILTVACINFSIVAFTQHSLGMRGGLTYSTEFGGVVSIDGEQKGYNSGFTFGLVYNANLTKVFSIQSEFLFVQGGYKSIVEKTINGIYNKTTYRITLNYVQIPVFAKVSFGSTNFKINVHTGPYLGLASGGKFRIKFEQNGEIDEGSSDIEVGEESMSAIDLGIAFGTGMNLKCGIGSIIADLRVCYGLTDSYNPGYKDSNYKSHHNFITAFTVGYMIPVGK